MSECECKIIHNEPIERVRNILKTDDVFNALAELFKALGDATRVKILYALAQEELCVCDISALFNLSQSATSHQLRVLRTMRLVKYRKSGRIVYYSLDDDHVRTLFDEGLEHAEE